MALYYPMSVQHRSGGRPALDESSRWSRIMAGLWLTFFLAPMREGGGPVGQSEPYDAWIPAFAGMSGGLIEVYSFLSTYLGAYPLSPG